MTPFRRAVLLPVMWYTSLGSATWTQLSNAGDIPSARYFHAMAVLPDGETAVMFGGWNNGYLGDAYTMVVSGTTSTWAQLSLAGDTPSAREYHEMTALPDGKIIMYGGNAGGANYLEEIYTLDVSGSTATWTLLSNVGDVPPGRKEHAMAAFSDGTLVTFGGDVDGCWPCDDMYTFTVTGTVATWSQKTTAGDVPSARSGHAMAVLADDTPVMFGGVDTGGVTNDVYTFTLSGSTATWTSLSSQGEVVPARYRHTLTALSDGSAVTFGGLDSSVGFLDDLYELQISGTTATWTQLSSNPSARADHTMVALADGTFVAFGGADGEDGNYDLLNDVDTLSLTVPTPLPTPSPTPLPTSLPTTSPTPSPTQSPSGSPTASPTLTVADASSACPRRGLDLVSTLTLVTTVAFRGVGEGIP